MTWPDDYINKIICGDCLEVMKGIPDQAIDIVITDPVWPGMKVALEGSADPIGLWNDAIKEISRISSRLIVIVSCRTDPRFLATVPKSIPFVRTIILPYVRPRYKGNILDQFDVAYYYGDGSLPEGRRLLGGQSRMQGAANYERGNTHPCYRPYLHMDFLVGGFTKQNWLILDPFAGSGTTCVAAKRGGRNFIGIEIVPEYCDMSNERLRQGQLSLDSDSTNR